MLNNRHIYPYGIVGNCSFLAYIDNKSNVVWQCWPRFDSSFIFGTILDEQKGGCFEILPETEIQKSEQHYVENTNVLCTEITCADGRYRVTDFAPRFEQFDRHFRPLMLVRKLEPLEGQPRIKVKCCPRGKYGEFGPEVSYASNHISYGGFDSQVRLTTDIPINYVREEKSFLLNDKKYLFLTWGDPMEAPIEETAETFFRKTVDYWRSWVEHCAIPQIYQKEVIRSSLALKLHQYEDTGAIIASGTTSLPESPGSGRNWDYRYVWLRDAYYTLAAFNRLGQFEELDRFSLFVRNIVASEPTETMQPVYSILGDRDLSEKEIPLAGYQNDKPVRIGNSAFSQIQNDIYGQVLLSLLPLYLDERIITRRKLKDLSLVEKLLLAIEKLMDKPDAGIWEFRNRKQLHCYTFLFHWAGAHAASKIGKQFKHSGIFERAEKLKVAASAQVEKCFDNTTKSYAASVEDRYADASLFQLVTMQFIDPKSEKARDHLAHMVKALAADGSGMFYRYVSPDDFGRPEVAFLVCGFWYVSALIAAGEVDKAQSAFEHLLKSGNHLGLLSEDIDPRDLGQRGNFVQTYSHVGVINCAFEIDRALNRPIFL